MSQDRIELVGLRAVGIHGALPEEQTRAQPFEVDVELHLDLRVPGQSDDLTDTIDYGAVAESVERIVTRERFQLLERLAERIADEVRRDRRVDSAIVTVRKLRPPVAVDLASAAVTITRP
ncbi:MAG: dihydroneopterin aldolase [Acidimicrobiia bacterium]|nr:dihydroneopterin aldolase [Acidimicrobiia bacterium]